MRSSALDILKDVSKYAPVRRSAAYLVDSVIYLEHGEMLCGSCCAEATNATHHPRPEARAVCFHPHRDIAATVLPRAILSA